MAANHLRQSGAAMRLMLLPWERTPDASCAPVLVRIFLWCECGLLCGVNDGFLDDRCSRLLPSRPLAGRVERSGEAGERGVGGLRLLRLTKNLEHRLLRASGAPH